MLHYLDRKSAIDCDFIVVKIVDTVGYYLKLLSQSFSDLDELRTAELRLLKLIQTASVSEYLTKFT
jgi:hypothetical protein